MFRRRDLDDADMPVDAGPMTNASPANTHHGSTSLPDMAGPQSYENIADTHDPAPSLSSDMPGEPAETPSPSPFSLPHTPSSTAETSPMFDSNRSASSNEFVTSDNGSKRTLAVGLETFLKGEISNCDRVVIEGGVDAVMGDVQSLEIAASGSFTGSATVQNAEISGTFEGDLIVGNRLVIHSTGRVTGKVSYGEIEVKRGGKLLGEITCNDQAVSQTDSGFSSFANNNDTSNKKVVDDASIAPMPVAEAV